MLALRQSKMRAGYAHILLLSFLAAGLSACVSTPRPTITINPERRALNVIRVSAEVVPNQFSVTDVVLEFGRRGSTVNPVNIMYNSNPNSYNLRRSISRTLPTAQPFDVRFTEWEQITGGFTVGEIIDYQFRVTHLSVNDRPLIWRSERRSFRIEPPIALGINDGNSGITVGSGSVKPNLMPALFTPIVLTRPIDGDINSTAPGNSVVNSFFCSGLSVNTATTVNVPDLIWGVSGSDIETANVAFDVELRVEGNSIPLDTLHLPQGFPANTPLVTTKNYPGRASSIRVVLNPTVQGQLREGCFTVPDSTQALDPRNLLIRVDPSGAIDEGSKEDDNDLPF